MRFFLSIFMFIIFSSCARADNAVSINGTLGHGLKKNNSIAEALTSRFSGRYSLECGGINKSVMSAMVNEDGSVGIDGVSFVGSTMSGEVVLRLGDAGGAGGAVRLEFIQRHGAARGDQIDFIFGRKGGRGHVTLVRARRTTECDIKAGPEYVGASDIFSIFSRFAQKNELSCHPGMAPHATHRHSFEISNDGAITLEPKIFKFTRSTNDATYSLTDSETFGSGSRGNIFSYNIHMARKDDENGFLLVDIGVSSDLSIREVDYGFMALDSGLSCVSISGGVLQP